MVTPTAMERIIAVGIQGTRSKRQPPREQSTKYHSNPLISLPNKRFSREHITYPSLCRIIQVARAVSAVLLASFLFRFIQSGCLLVLGRKTDPP